MFTAMAIILPVVHADMFEGRDRDNNIKFFVAIGRFPLGVKNIGDTLLPRAECFWSQGHNIQLFILPYWVGSVSYTHLTLPTICSV